MVSVSDQRPGFSAPVIDRTRAARVGRRVKSKAGQVKRRAPGLVAVLGALAVAAVTLTAPAPAAARADDPDIDTAATYTYEVDLEDEEIEVTIELSVTADIPNRTTSEGVFQYYVEGAALAVPTGVEQLLITDSAGRELTYEIESSRTTITQLVIGFRRNIFYRETADLIISFVLPGGEARGFGLTRVNGAYAGFEAWVDPRLEQATVEILAPEGFVNRSSSSDLFVPTPIDNEATGADDAPDPGSLRLVAEDVDPEEFWAGVSLTRDDELVSTKVPIDWADLTLESWPNDPEWAEFVSDQLDEGMPVLIDMVGLEWPAWADLTIIESFTPYLAGYAGWFDPATVEIEIGDQLDAHVLFHEVSHVWFNDEMFEHRWITEGLADYYGAAVVESMGEARPTLPEVDSSDRQAGPLNGWKTTASSDREQWSYGASWTVTEQLVDRLGAETLSAAVQAAMDRDIAYLGDGLAESFDGPRDWRYYLDLLENRVEGGDGRVAELFEQWVLTEDESGLLGSRREARLRYVALTDTGGPWAPPLVIRTEMSEWDFAAATVAADQSEVILGLRDEIGGAVAAFDGDLPPVLETSYEQAATQAELDETAIVTSQALSAATELGTTAQRIDNTTGFIERVGGIGSDHDGDLRQAVESFDQGEFDLAAGQVAILEGDLDGLFRQGLIRLIALAVGLIAVLGGLFWLRRRATRRARPDDTNQAGPPSGLALGPLAPVPVTPPSLGQLPLPRPPPSAAPRPGTPAGSG